MKAFIRSALLPLMLLSGAVHAYAQGTVVYTSNPVITHGMKNQGTYSAGTTYSANDVVIYSGGSYLSLVSSNIGHTPSSSPTQWQPLGSTSGSPVTSVNSHTGVVVLAASDVGADAAGAAAAAVTSAAVTTVIKTQTGCTTSGYVWSPQSSTCVAQSTVTASNVQTALNAQTGCTTTGYVYSPVTNTCIAQTAAVTAAAMQSALSTATGCTTAGYVWIPASNTCVSASGGTNPGATAAIYKWTGTAWVVATPGTDFYAPDSVNNSQEVFQAGTGGDSTCVAAGSGKDITCYFTAANAKKRSINGGAYEFIPHVAAAGTAGHVWGVSSDGTGLVDIGAATSAGLTISPITLTTSAVSGNLCEASAHTQTVTGLASTNKVFFTPTAEWSGVTGWGPGTSGGLYLDYFVSANTLTYKVCNSTGTAITPGAAVTLNVGVQ